MAEFIADFHIHSKYSRACSKDLTIPELARWATLKGVGLLGTGDFTHPLWLEELKDTLRETGTGFYEHGGIQFVWLSLGRRGRLYGHRGRRAGRELPGTTRRSGQRQRCFLRNAPTEYRRR